MRVFVCNAYLLALRSVYIMTTSALALTLIQAKDKPKRRGELVFAAVLVGPFALAPPVALYLGGKRFLEHHHDKEGHDDEWYRGWLEDFAATETASPMADTVLASLLMPFTKKKWGFAVSSTKFKIRRVHI